VPSTLDRNRSPGEPGGEPREREGAEHLHGQANAITMGRCGHLMPGNEGEAATLLDTYLDAAAR
jgi:hypothetical protein